MADLTATEGETVVVEHETTNRGDSTGTQDIALEVDGTQADAETGVELEPDAVHAGHLSWATAPGDAGTYQVCVVTDDREDCLEVEVVT